MNSELVAAVIAAFAAVVAAIVAVAGQRSAHRLETAFRERQESGAFLEQKLARFYAPMATHLAVTQKLFHRFGEADTAERTAIEHELRNHNRQIVKTLVDAGMYLEPDAPEGLADQLLEHLMQWEIVYKLKYEHQVYQGPVFAGIAQFGFRAHPGAVADEYFSRSVKELRRRHHDRLRASGAA